MPSTAAGGRDIGAVFTACDTESSTVPPAPLMPVPLNDVAPEAADENDGVFSDIEVASPVVGFRIFCTSLRNHSVVDDRDAAAVDIRRVDFPAVGAVVDAAAGSADVGTSFSLFTPLFLDFFDATLGPEPDLLPDPVFAVKDAYFRVMVG